MRQAVRSIALCLVLLSGSLAAETGFLVLAPDRGFVGNNFTRDAFEPFAADYPAELVFVTDERARPYFERAVSALVDSGADRIVLLPLYLSGAHPDFDRIEGWVNESRAAGESARLLDGRPFGQSYLAARVLADRLARADVHDGRLVVVGQGAENAGQAADMQAALERLAVAGADGAHFDSVDARVLAADEDMAEALADLDDKTDDETYVLPFHLGPLYSEMMAWSNWLRRSLPEDVHWLEGEILPHPAVTAWMRREALRYEPVDAQHIGVVVHAHGSDFHWNETMRAAAAPLAENYLVEYAFSMGGAPTLERAVERLEQRGARAVVIVRVFSMANSFLGGIERFIGADYESCRAGTSGGHGHGSAHSRLLTSLPVVTVGGLEDHRFFARVLLERARSLSQTPQRETVILVAHGKGDDEDNAEWIGLLESIREQMIEAGGDDFRAIEVGTWREDWPDKRDAAKRRIRGLIEAAAANDGRALVIPARTTGQGPARDLVDDLPYELGEGFAPHPLFVEWLGEQVERGRRDIVYDPAANWSCAE